MFGTDNYNEPVHTGKRVQGMQARKDSEFSLGWSGNTVNQLNQHQNRKSKNFQVTGKVTQSVQRPQDKQAILRPINSYQIQNEPVYTPETKLQEYERLLREYPDIPAEELERIVMGEQQKPRGAQRNQVPINNSGRKGANQYKMPSNQAITSHQQESSSSQRTPIKPRESMKNIIYGSDIGGQNENPRKVMSRRNNTNLILGDGYNHFKNPY